MCPLRAGGELWPANLGKSLRAGRHGSSAPISFFAAAVATRPGGSDLWSSPLARHDAVLVAVLFGPVPPIAMTDALRWFCRCAVNLTHPVTFAIPARPTLAAALNPRSVGPRNIRSGPLGLFGIAASSRNHNRGSERGLFLRRGSAARSAPAHIRHTNFNLGRQSPGLRKRCH